jgi:hypothetical protein
MARAYGAPKLTSARSDSPGHAVPRQAGLWLRPGGSGGQPAAAAAAAGRPGRVSARRRPAARRAAAWRALLDPRGRCPASARARPAGPPPHNAPPPPATSWPPRPPPSRRPQALQLHAQGVHRVGGPHDRRGSPYHRPLRIRRRPLLRRPLRARPASPAARGGPGAACPPRARGRRSAPATGLAPAALCDILGAFPGAGSGRHSRSHAKKSAAPPPATAAPSTAHCASPRVGWGLAVGPPGGPRFPRLEEPPRHTPPAPPGPARRRYFALP